MTISLCGSSRFERARTRAIDRGMHFLERRAAVDGSSDRLGSGLLYCTSFMAATAADAALRQRARRLAVAAFRSWQKANGAQPLDDASTLAAHIQSYDAASRVGLRFADMRVHLRRRAREHAPEDFLWFDPAVEPPPNDVPELCSCHAQNLRAVRRCFICGKKLERMSAARVWYLCFTLAYCGDRLGVTLGRRYVDAMQWLPQMRRYRGPSRDVTAFYDSVYAATHVVYTLNDYGRYLLDPAWLPHEYYFLASHLEHALATNDPDVVGEFLDSLRAFGHTAEDQAIRYAMNYLIETQNRDGSWGAREGTITYRRFHATWAAIDGLRDFRWKRRGLSFPQLLPDLRRWAHIA